MFKNLRFRTQIILGNSAILAVICVVGVVVFLSVSELIESFGQVEHTYEVIANGE